MEKAELEGMGRKRGMPREEAPPGFEPGMVDLQSTALATWLRRLGLRLKGSSEPTNPPIMYRPAHLRS